MKLYTLLTISGIMSTKKSTSPAIPPKNSTQSNAVLASNPRFSRFQLMAAIAGFVLFGLLIIFITRAAASPIATVEAEKLSLPVGGSVVSDTAASNGRAIKLTAPGTAASGTDTLSTAALSSTAVSVTIRAKAELCSGNPKITAKVGTIILPARSIPSTNWVDYSYSVTIPASTTPYNLGIEFSDDYTDYAGNSGNAKCSRSLLVDKITFFGETIIMPEIKPTVMITSPSNGANVSGSIIVEATASGPNPIVNVKFYIDGTPANGYKDGTLAKTENVAPYCLNGDAGTTSPCNLWDSKNLSNGLHTITAYSYDASNESLPSTVSINVQNLVTASGPPPAGAGWTRVLSDLFDSGSLPSHWSPYNSVYRAHDSSKPGPDNCASPGQNFISGGNLVMRMQWRDNTVCRTWDPVTFSGWWTGGMSLKGFSSNDQSVTLRWRVVNNGVTSHRVVPMLWPDVGQRYNGESDYCEGHDNLSCTSFIHYYNDSSNCYPDCQIIKKFPIDLTQWHTMRFDQRNHELRTYFDNLSSPVWTCTSTSTGGANKYCNSTTVIDSVRHLVLQQECASYSAECPARPADITRTTEDIEIDWITVDHPS
jgi:hypothetical protein